MTGMTLEHRDRRSPQRALAERVLVVAPTGDDASLVRQMLSGAGMEVALFEDLAALAAEIPSGAGVVLIASEALVGEGVPRLRTLLDGSEAWSELPVLLLGDNVDSESGPAEELLGGNAHLVLLERPLGLSAFLTAVDAALRSRRRQYEVKRLLDNLAEAARAVAQAHAEANHAKDEFLATLGHELRSPMTAIQGWIQMLKMGELDAAEAADALSMIESSTKVQSHIIEDLMDISRIIAGKVMIHPAPIELRTVVENIVATFRSSAALKGVQLTAEIPTESLTAWADESRIQQVGWNVLSNAIKFTPRGGSVRVSLERLDQTAVIRVRDTGRGIPP